MGSWPGSSRQRAAGLGATSPGRRRLPRGGRRGPAEHPRGVCAAPTSSGFCHWSRGEVRERCVLPPLPLQEHPLGRGIFSGGPLRGPPGEQAGRALRVGLSAPRRAAGGCFPSGALRPEKTGGFVAGEFRQRGLGGRAGRSICAPGPVQHPAASYLPPGGGAPKHGIERAAPQEERSHQLLALVRLSVADPKSDSGEAGLAVGEGFLLQARG